jgi:hypothetical protein
MDGWMEEPYGEVQFLDGSPSRRDPTRFCRRRTRFHNSAAEGRAGLGLLCRATSRGVAPGTRRAFQISVELAGMGGRRRVRVVKGCRICHVVQKNGGSDELSPGDGGRAPRCLKTHTSYYGNLPPDPSCCCCGLWSRSRAAKEAPAERWFFRHMPGFVGNRCVARATRDGDESIGPILLFLDEPKTAWCVLPRS